MVYLVLSLLALLGVVSTMLLFHIDEGQGWVAALGVLSYSVTIASVGAIVGIALT